MSSPRRILEDALLTPEQALSQGQATPVSAQEDGRVFVPTTLTDEGRPWAKLIIDEPSAADDA